MTTYTCYPDIGWCGDVLITQDSTGPETALVTPNTTEDNAKPTAVHQSKTQTKDDKEQPEQTKEAKPGGSSARHSSNASATPTPSADTNTSPSDAVQTVAPSVGSGGISAGAVAGIAIAAAVVGGAIAFLVAFILFKRRRRSPGHKHSDSSTAFMASMKGEHPTYVQVSQVGPPPIVAAAAQSGNRNTNLSDLSHSPDFLAGVLPPKADEQSVRNRVTALFSQIHQHVDDFYRDVQATLTPTMKSDLKRFTDTSVNLADELEHSSMPTIAIKHALTGYILGIVAPEAAQQSTLFPVEVAGLKENERSTESIGQSFILHLAKLKSC